MSEPITCCVPCASGTGDCVGKSQDLLSGGRADKLRPGDFDSKVLAEGTEHELEHVDNRAMAQEIAMDHLAEDSEYYKKLKRIEKTLEALPDLTFKKARKLVRRMKLHGLDVSIETDKGQSRHWHDPHSGESGSTKMKYPYGYIRRTMGADDEQVDVYVGPSHESRRVFVIRQLKKPKFEEYDEDKVMMGFESPKEAKAAYIEHYNSPRFFGSMKELDIDEFKEKFIIKSLDSGVNSEYNIHNESDNTGPPPIDVETPTGIDYLLSRMGSIGDDELMQVVSEIWGEGHQIENTPAQQVREEVVGFLLDQRDLFAAAPEMAQPQPESPAGSFLDSTDYSHLSQSSNSERIVRSSEANSFVEGSMRESLPGLSHTNILWPYGVGPSEATH